MCFKKIAPVGLNKINVHALYFTHYYPHARVLFSKEIRHLVFFTVE
jgi:hypothetical protein